MTEALNSGAASTGNILLVGEHSGSGSDRSLFERLAVSSDSATYLLEVEGGLSEASRETLAYIAGRLLGKSTAEPRAFDPSGKGWLYRVQGVTGALYPSLITSIDASMYGFLRTDIGKHP